MPRRKPSRSQRRARRQTAAPERPAPAPTPTRAVARPIPVAATPGEAPQQAKEPSVTRLTTRDYSYIRREVIQILVLATAVLITLVVLSFFLP